MFVDGSTVDVYAGSSLTNVLQSAEPIFEERNEGVDIRLNLGGSNALSRHIVDGGGADVFIPADDDVLDDASRRAARGSNRSRSQPIASS